MKVIQKREIATVENGESITDRQERIEGWRQDRISQGRALVIGAGAIGNEVVKNLALMGLGYMFIADFDKVESTNLSRAVLFSKDDLNRSKAEVVAERARLTNVMSTAHAQPFNGDVVWELGAGVFRRVDVVIGCLDNVEARMAINAACLFTGKPFIDGGIRGLAGNVSAVHPPFTPCWTCTTTARERESASLRYESCTRVMRRDIQSGKVPTVQVASSIVAGFQSQEAIKVIQGHDWASGYMIQYFASGRKPDINVVEIARRPGCWCNKANILQEVVELPLSARVNTLFDLTNALKNYGVNDPQFVLPNAFVLARHCNTCNRTSEVMKPKFRLDTSVLQCSFCGAKRDKIELIDVEHTHPSNFVDIENGLTYRKLLQTMKLNDLGFPLLALIGFTDGKMGIDFDAPRAVELTADAVHIMGNSDFTSIR